MGRDPWRGGWGHWRGGWGHRDRAHVPERRGRLWQRVLLRLGVSYSRYASHFVKVYGSYDNPYLNREERLDLRSTYVPLSFRGGDNEQHVQPAAQVLADLHKSHTVIVGSPGSASPRCCKRMG